MQVQNDEYENEFVNEIVEDFEELKADFTNNRRNQRLKIISFNIRSCRLNWEKWKTELQNSNINWDVIAITEIN
jgi:hypothetical protein